MLSGCVSLKPTGTSQASNPASRQDYPLQGTSQLLPGERTVIGTVKAIHGNQIKVEFTDSLQPRYLPLAIAEAKGMKIQPGDPVKMVFNDQQVLVDFHPLGNKDSHHAIITGYVAEEMKVGQERVVIKDDNGEPTTYEVRPLIRSKLASMPIGAPAVFLVDETNQVVDVTFGDSVALEEIKREYRQISSPKAPHLRINAIVVGMEPEGHITVKTTDGEQRVYPLRPYAAKELARVHAGDEIILLIDSSQQVLDVAGLNKR